MNQFNNQQSQHPTQRRNQGDDCDECCDCGDCCCNDCCKDCECNECGCDCLNTIKTDCFQNWQCCPCMACCTAGDILTELHFHRHVDEEEQNKSLSEEFKQLILNYKIKGQYKHPILGDTFMLTKKKKAPPQKYESLLLKTFWFSKHSDYNNALQKWISLILNNRIIQALYGTKVPDLCIDRFRLCILFPKIIQLNQVSSFPISTFLFQMGSQLLQHHQSLQETAYFHPDLVHCDSEFFLIPPSIQEKTLYEQYQKEPAKTIHPPEWENQSDTFHDWDKCDAFLVGFCALATYFKASLHEFYDERGIFQAGKLDPLLQKLKVGSHESQLLTCLLQPLPAQRAPLAIITQQLKHVQHSAPKVNFPEPQLSKVSRVSQNNYVGETLNDKRHGQGKLVNSDGSGYEGEWAYDLMHGRGELFGPNGVLIYRGGFSKGKFNGFGHLQNPHPEKEVVDPNNFAGTLRNNWLRYEGDFRDDRMHGHGILYLTNGDRWAGEFRDDLPNGYGTHYSSDKQVLDGQWLGGVRSIP